MTTTFALAPYRESMIQVATTVYETMLDLPIRAVAERGSTIDSALTGAVYYAGSWKGALLLECSMEQANDWAARLMSLRPPVQIDDMRDGLGELTNVISSNLKPVLPPGVGLSLPSVVHGHHSLRICGENLSESLFFEDHLGIFRVTLVQMKAL